MAAKRLVKVLSIDGGGIRGIIPAIFLAEIERLTELPACQLFDLIAGTSTGGIIALGVTVPDADDRLDKPRPKWTAQQLAELYASEGPKIFHRSLLRTVETVDGLLVEKYAATALERALDHYMGDTRLSEALTDVLIPAYDIQKHEPFFYKSFIPRPRAGPRPRDRAVKSSTPEGPSLSTSEYPMTVVARSTSAAPTYFEPEHVRGQHTPGAPPDYALIDGGTFANNPSLCAYAEALRNHPDAEVFVVSLGTGRLTDSISFNEAEHWGLAQWARPLLGVIMDGSSAAIDYQLDELLGADDCHFRFQTVLDGVSDRLDDASATNIEGLRALAGASIKSNSQRLATVCERLTAETAAITPRRPREPVRREGP
jgi:patatin-like phospholipase/acyl hydrolase